MEKMPARRPRPGGTISCFLTNWTRECKVNIRQEDKEGNFWRSPKTKLITCEDP